MKKFSRRHHTAELHNFVQLDRALWPLCTEQVLISLAIAKQGGYVSSLFSPRRSRTLLAVRRKFRKHAVWMEGEEKCASCAIAPRTLRNYCRKLHLGRMQLQFLLFCVVFRLERYSIQISNQNPSEVNKQRILLFWKFCLLPDGAPKMADILSRRPSKRGSVCFEWHWSRRRGTRPLGSSIQ